MSNRSSLFPTNLKVGLLSGSASLAAAGTASGLFLNTHQDNLKKIIASAGEAISPLLDPIKTGVEQLQNQLDSFSKQGYNSGVDVKEWVTGNFSKSKIKHGGMQVYENLKSWYETANSFVKTAHETVKGFFEKWEDSRETMHIVFKSIGNSFSLLGGLVSSSSGGESKIKILFEVLAHEEFRGFANAVSSLTSKNPSLFSQLQGDDIYDVLTAFRQEPKDVTSILETLAKEPDNSVDRDKFVSALKLQSLMGKATSLGTKARNAIAKGDKELAKKLRDEIEKILPQLKSVIDSAGVTQAQ